MKTHTTRFRKLLPALAVASLFPASVLATSFSWNSTGGKFDTASNWTQSGPLDLDGIPDANDTTTFNRGNVPLYSVFFGDLLVPNSDIHPTVDRVIIGNNPLSFVGLHGSTLTVDSTNITETARGVVIGSGAGDVAALTSTLAMFDTQYATLGSAAGSSGTLNLTSSSAGAFSVSGTGATYDLIVGLNGTGTINVTNGRDMTVADDTVLGLNATGIGIVNVSGAGSSWTSTSDLTVGSVGSGALNVGAGANVAVGGRVLIGANGTVNFSGASSAWSSGKIHLGGTFNITSAATLSGTEVSLESGTLAVTGTDSSWIPSNTDLSGGTVNISNGGSVLDLSNSLLPWLTNDGSVNINVSAGGSLITGSGINSMASLYPGRRVSVTGANSVWRSDVGHLYVEAGTRVTVSDGGRFDYVGDVEVNSGGELEVQGAGAIVRPNPVGVLHIGAGGTLTVSNGGTVQGTLFIERSTSGAGTLKGNGNVDYLDSDGIIAPGDSLSVGALHVLSDSSFGPSGTLQIKLGGTTPESEYDQLLVAGDIALDGTLQVSLISPFSPAFGDSFNILDWGGTRTGQFAALDLPTLNGALAWDLKELYTSGVLSVILAGDYNFNGIVDAADYVVWRKNPGGFPAAAYDVWRASFGATIGSGSSISASAAIPEPATLVLLILAAAGCCLSRGGPHRNNPTTRRRVTYTNNSPFLETVNSSSRFATNPCIALSLSSRTYASRQFPGDSPAQGLIGLPS